MALPQPGQDRIIDRIDRREIDMAAFGRLNVIGRGRSRAAAAPQMGDAQPGAGADHADRAQRGQRHIGAGEMEKIIGLRARHRMGDRRKIVEHDRPVEPQLLVDLRRSGSPSCCWSCARSRR